MLVVELCAATQPDQDHPPVIHMRDGEVLEGGLSLAAIDGGLEGVVQSLALEHTNHDRVGSAGQGARGRGLDVHDQARY
jgi:hypothetical protein